MLLQLLLLILVVGNSATATTATKANSCTGNSATASKLATARNIKLQGAVSGNTNFDGSGNITITTTQTNIAILDGTKALTKSSEPGVKYSQNMWEIDYPSGYNKNNSILLAYGGTFGSNGAGFAFGDVNIASSANGTISGAVPRCVTLTDSKLRVQAWNIGDAKTLTYRIVLMKIQ